MRLCNHEECVCVPWKPLCLYKVILSIPSFTFILFTEFRVQVKEVEGLAVSGAADLVMGNGRLALHAPDTGTVARLCVCVCAVECHALC